MMDPETESIFTVLFKNGTYYINQKSNVMVIASDFNDVTDKEMNDIYIACTKAKVNLMMYPPKVTEMKTSPLPAMINWFLRLNLVPSFLFKIKILSPLFISDDAIYLGKNDLLDKENMIDQLISEDKPWLYVKNDEQSEDHLTKLINNDIERERGIMSTTMVLGKNGIKNMGKLFLLLGEMVKKKE